MDHQMCCLQAFGCRSDDNINTVLTSESYISNFIKWWNTVSKMIPAQSITRGQLFCPLDFGLHKVHAGWSGWFSSAASLVQIIAVTTAGPIVTLAELPDPSAGLHHHLLRHRHHNAKEVRILKRLGEDRTWIFLGIEVIVIFQFYWKCKHVDTCKDKWIHDSSDRNRDGVLLRQADRRQTARSPVVQ